jgi:carboxyl-terminal processing protease
MSNEFTPTIAPRRINFLGVILSLVLAGAAFFSGVQFGSGSVPPPENQTAGLFSLFAGTPEQSVDGDLTEFWKVWELLDQKFAASGTSSPELSKEQKIQGAIDGLVRAYGDPYTAYFPPTEATAFAEDIAGNFSGVGMEVGIRNDVITVISPLSGTPAEKAGIIAGDVIVTINGTSTENMSVENAVKLIRGEEGTEVSFEIYRTGETELLKLTVTRAQIEIPTVKTEKRGDTFIITLYSFNALAEQKVQAALREYVQSGARKMVLDVRGNPGGYLQSAVSIGSYFLPAGKVILRESFGDGSPEQVYRSSGKTLKQFAPQEMVVLIDGGSASAAEILAGALGQHDAATLIGSNSFGKGSVQELVNLPSGSAVKITIARWLTPDGTSISNGGISPDIVVERTPAERIAGEDPQLEAALQYLAGTYTPATTTATTTAARP